MAWKWKSIMGAVLVCLLLVGGACSKKQEAQLPPPPPPNPAQKRVERVSKLRSVASAAAEQVAQTVHSREELRHIPIYMRPPMDTVFARTFHQLLFSELVSRGLPLSVQQEDSLVLDFSVQDDVLLTVQLTHDNRYVVFTSSIEYVGSTGADSQIRDAVWGRYAKRRPAYIR